MEVKIGVLHAQRELTFESNESPESIEKAVTSALNKDSGLLSLADERGRRILIPADRVGYVEIGPGRERRVGFSPE